MMCPVMRDSLMSLETYARERPGFRARVIEHKKLRTVPVGEHLTLMFEDEFTIRYQIQEMLRIERTFEEAGIEDELRVYNPLVPDGHNWKATMMLEFPDEVERRAWLARLLGVEHRVWVRVDGYEPVFAIADEDLDRSTSEKTSSVHFLRFELEPSMVRAMHSGAGLAVGVDHPEYRAVVDPVSGPVRDSLCGDLHS